MPVADFNNGVLLKLSPQDECITENELGGLFPKGALDLRT